MLKKVTVSLGDRSYLIFIGEEILSETGKHIRPYLSSDRAIIISDRNVFQLFGATVSSSLNEVGVKPQKILVPSGEGTKSLDVAVNVYQELAKHKVERNNAIIALGGGVIGDLAGFVASTYLRGLPFFQIPTTLLAQVDSSIGGKVGVNLGTWKNLIGSFYQPKAVVADVSLVKDLPDQEVSNGLAEMIKTAFISSEHMVSFMESKQEELLKLDSNSLTLLIEECCRFKAKVIEHDEKEAGLRRILNYGHTFGHAIESASELRWTHGQAVSAGIMFAAALAYKLGVASVDIMKRQSILLSKSGLPTSIPVLNESEVFAALRQDKKRSGGKIAFVIVQSPGKTRVIEVDEKEVKDIMDEYPAILKEVNKL